MVENEAVFALLEKLGVGQVNPAELLKGEALSTSNTYVRASLSSSVAPLHVTDHEPERPTRTVSEPAFAVQVTFPLGVSFFADTFSVKFYCSCCREDPDLSQ